MFEYLQVLVGQTSRNIDHVTV